MGRYRTISIGDDILDSREIEERIDELQEEIEAAESDAIEENRKRLLAGIAAEQMIYPHGTPERAILDAHVERIESAEFTFAEVWRMDDEHPAAEQQEELKKWEELRDDCDSRSWRGGITFILDSHFQAYAEQLAEDIGAINRNASWPNNCIDWERAANELKSDYSVVEIDGNTYYYND